MAPVSLPSEGLSFLICKVEDWTHLARTTWNAAPAEDLCAGVRSGAQGSGHTWQGTVSLLLIPGKGPSSQPGPETGGTSFCLPWSFRVSLCGGAWGHWGSPDLFPPPPESLWSSSEYFPLKQKQNNNTPEAKHSFFLPAILSSDGTSGPLPTPDPASQAHSLSLGTPVPVRGKGEGGDVASTPSPTVCPALQRRLAFTIRLHPPPHTPGRNINTSILQRKTQAGG